MITRRLLIAAAPLTGCAASTNPATPAPAAATVPPPVPVATPNQAPEIDLQTISSVPFDRFVEGVKAEGRRRGISTNILNAAFAGVRPNQRVIQLDRRQAEGGLPWEEYRDRIMVSPTRVQNGRRNYTENAELLRRIEARFRVSPRVIVAIWGVETNFGGNTGGFKVVEALSTLAWEGRRASYFRNELFAALKILDEGHIRVDRMTGSWAGAMGQPQFMPSNFDRYAVDFDGDGRRDIWDDKADALGSIANYFARSGWRHGEPWGLAVTPPPGFSLAGADTETKRPMRDFARMGFRTEGGGALPDGPEAQVVLPNRGSGQVFLGHHNLRVIRRYNSPVNYGLAVGLLSDRVG
ncbi:lytic murein transglycosylase [Roseomonas sp. HJA6]|uniref:Lytic murein transglycosylase n=1 Tax=Roseomonas alba TaxID=2846776 RepID=A0ABS7A5T0_9PROT|nr:lytic murein transglycosylase [Neoroseomonas alba]MBW6397611.1 lytic murein transglycosylase [Neoroseomonas alba]